MPDAAATTSKCCQKKLVLAKSYDGFWKVFPCGRQESIKNNNKMIYFSPWLGKDLGSNGIKK